VIASMGRRGSSIEEPVGSMDSMMARRVRVIGVQVECHATTKDADASHWMLNGRGGELVAAILFRVRLVPALAAGVREGRAS
jgi:hypothetical protein